MKKELEKDLKVETKKRLSRMKEEFSEELELKSFENTEKYDQIIIQTGIPFIAHCEHHHLSFTGFAHVGYIPGSWVLGLSKLGRIVEKFLNPTIYTIQEKATQQIMNYLRKELNPRGIMVVLEAEHSCISFRGVKKPSLTITSAIHGLFETNFYAKMEFLELIKGR